MVEPSIWICKVEQPLPTRDVMGSGRYLADKPAGVHRSWALLCLLMSVHGVWHKVPVDFEKEEPEGSHQSK